jgi:hypothetical protein
VSGAVDTTKEFLGVPISVQLAIGRIVIAAGHVEWVVERMAAACGVPSGPFAVMLRKIKRQAAAGQLPVWHRVADPPALVEWIDRAIETMARRNGEVHAAQVKLSDGGAWIAARTHIRTSSTDTSDLEKLETIASVLVTLLSEGLGHMVTFLPEVKKGNYILIRRENERDPHILLVTGGEAASPDEIQATQEHWSLPFPIGPMIPAHPSAGPAGEDSTGSAHVRTP